MGTGSQEPAEDVLAVRPGPFPPQDEKMGTGSQEPAEDGLAVRPGPSPPQDEDPSKAPAVPGAMTYCHACGSIVDPRAFVCPKCGVKQRSAVTMDGIDPGIVAVVSILFSPWIGMLLVKRWGLAAAYFGALVVSALLIAVLVGLLLMPVVWIGGAFHAYKIAKANQGG